MARLSSIARIVCTLALVLAAVTPAKADLTVTATGAADGFTLSEFIGGGYFGTYGPLAQGILPDGNVITGSLLNTSGGGGLTLMVFPDVNGQTLSSATIATPYAPQTGNPQWAFATAGGQVYGAQLQGNAVYEHFANNGTFTPIPNLAAAGLFNSLGMWGDPLNGHIIAASNKGLVEIDPVAGTFRVINGTLIGNIDGVTLSPDGSTIYVALIGGGIQAYNFVTGALIQSYSATFGQGADGTGVISGGTFNGDVIVNNNNGTVGLLNPVTGSYTIIANGGTRGDFVSPDTSNGTLFLSQQDSIDRLSCGTGCSIGSGPVPEPSSLLLLAAGLVGMVGMGLYKRVTAI